MTNRNEQVTISASSLLGSLAAPVSKSAMQRACAAALIHKGITIIRNPGRSNDDRAALEFIRQLGATVIDESDTLHITGNGVQPKNHLLNCGESGLGVRMFTPLIALAGEAVTINGEGSLLSRPLNFFDEVLPQLGVAVKSLNGYLPLTVRGPLQPRNISIDGSLSSQFLTGLLMAFSAANASGVTITVNNLASKPYIDLTLQLMSHFRMKMPQHHGYKEFYFPEEIQPAFKGTIDYTVEGDWSGGAFLLVAGAIAGNITVTGLNSHSTQADKAILDALEKANAAIITGEQEIQVRRSALRAFEFDATDCPDLFPPLAALAAYCDGDTAIKGVHRLTHKESNRALTLQEEMAKMNVPVLLHDDVMIIKGGNEVKGGTVHSHNDHRIAMACAVAALRANGSTVIEQAMAVKKSYPDFYEHLKAAGAIIR